MHHVVVEYWSRGTSPLHARDARAKLVSLLVFLVALATTPIGAVLPVIAYAALLTLGVIAARLPLGSLLLRASVVLPFSVTFAVISWLAGDLARGLALVERSYLSAAAVLLLVATTPQPSLLRGLESLGVPRILVLIAQTLYRYLFVISEQAQHMRLAAACRGGKSHKRIQFHAAAGALAVLFARSYLRAEGIHRAMISRGFRGHFSLLAPPRFGRADLLFTVGVSTLVLAVRLQVVLA